LWVVFHCSVEKCTIATHPKKQNHKFIVNFIIVSEPERVKILCNLLSRKLVQQSEKPHISECLEVVASLLKSSTLETLLILYYDLQ